MNQLNCSIHLDIEQDHYISMGIDNRQGIQYMTLLIQVNSIQLRML